ncbi:hypothetical protein C8Q75DRAFT_494668 [Abortiporus biennis]|nr:hypothetical protein C8Q75DRAFT_494668 [Abortiporus biennis]
MTSPYSFTSFSIAAGSLALATLPGMIGLEYLFNSKTDTATNKSVPPSLKIKWTIQYELIWLYILIVLWIVSAVWVGSQLSVLNDLCSNNPDVTNLGTACTENKASVGISCIGVILLLVYTSCLLHLVLRARRKGSLNVWSSSVRELFDTPSSSLPPSSTNPHIINLNGAAAAGSQIPIDAFDPSKQQTAVYQENISQLQYQQPYGVTIPMAVQPIPPQQYAVQPQMMSQQNYSYPPQATADQKSQPETGNAQQYFGQPTISSPLAQAV